MEATESATSPCRDVRPLHVTSHLRRRRPRRVVTPSRRSRIEGAIARPPPAHGSLSCLDVRREEDGAGRVHDRPRRSIHRNGAGRGGSPAVHPPLLPVFPTLRAIASGRSRHGRRRMEGAAPLTPPPAPRGIRGRSNHCCSRRCGSGSKTRGGRSARSPTIVEPSGALSSVPCMNGDASWTSLSAKDWYSAGLLPVSPAQAPSGRTTARANSRRLPNSLISLRAHWRVPPPDGRARRDPRASTVRSSLTSRSGGGHGIVRTLAGLRHGDRSHRVPLEALGLDLIPAALASASCSWRLAMPFSYGVPKLAYRAPTRGL